MSPLAELPDLVIPSKILIQPTRSSEERIYMTDSTPVSQYPYESRICKVIEYLPVSIAVISQQGKLLLVTIVLLFAC